MKNVKSWKIFIFSALCFLFVGVLYITMKNYLLGGLFSMLGAIYFYLSRAQYKNEQKKSIFRTQNEKFVSLKLELKELIAENKKYEAINRFREVTGANIKESMDYIEKICREK